MACIQDMRSMRTIILHINTTASDDTSSDYNMTYMYLQLRGIQE